MSYEREFNMTGNFPIEELVGLFGPAARNILGGSNRRGTQGGQQATASPARRNVTMPVDVVNEERFIYIYVEVPGVNKDDIQLDFYNNKITVGIDKNRPYSAPDMSEIKYGHSERTITLPICVTKKETVSVTYKNGILRIKINKFIEEENKFSVRVDDSKTDEEVEQ
jgi:HSP20 family protein